MAFALGAIVSPTDPAAATAIMRRVGAPRRLVNILEGESLFNDATALVAYKVAVAAAVGASFSAGDAVLEFFRDAFGGIAIGVVVGFAIAEVRKRVNDVNTELTISLFSAYGAFIPADQLGLSGVLAAVTCGVYLGWRAPEIASPESRMQAFGMWTTLTFLLNAALFILIGLQLPVIVDGLSGRPAGEVMGYAAAVCAAVIGVRFLWNFFITTLIRTDRPQAVAARAPGELAQPRGRRLGGHARRGLAGGGAGAAAPDRRRRSAPGPRADPVHHLLPDPRHRGRAGPHASLPDPPPGGRRGRLRGGERGAPGPARDRPRRARARGPARGGGLDPRRHRRAGAAGSTSSASGASRSRPGRSRTRTASRRARSSTSG